MMATAGPPSSSSFLPLLESVEDSAAGQSEQTDAYLTIANRLSGEEGRQFLPAVEKHFPRLGKATLGHITSPNAELSQAALQALGFCVYHSHVVSAVPEALAAEILSALCSLVVKSTDKNTCTRALWVISKQSFPPDVVAKKVPSILGTLEGVWSREDIQSVVMEHEALNVVIRLLEQVPTPMGEGAVRWAKLVIPLVVHSASKVRLRAAAAMEMGMPLLLQKQAEVAAIIEPIMSSKLIPELQKLFMSKNETNVLKLWPLFVKLLGKLLHRGGPFINSLLHLEELGFRSSSPTIKKIAFIAWKSLIDNFALNPDILCSSKRMKLLMQPLASINVRTEALMLTKVEVWWYLGVQLGPNLSANFDLVSVPLLQCTIGSESSTVPGTPSRAVSQNGSVTPGTPKPPSTPGFSSPANTSRMSLNSSVQYPSTFPSIQLLGLEMLLHFFMGPEVIASATKNKLVLSLEPLNHPLLSGASSFTKHAVVLTSNIRDGFINIGKEAPDALLAVIWTSLVRFVSFTIESGSKKDRQGCEVLTLTLQALQSIVSSEALPADKVLILFEATVKGIPQRVLGSASYQVGKMDVLNGTPALFLIQLLYSSSMLPAYIEDERFFLCLQNLVGCGLSGHTSPLAFVEAVLGAIRRSAATLQNKEQLWRMWSVMVSPLIDTVTQSNEVNQGDALEHNFSAMHSALLFPVTHLLPGTPLQQASQKSMLSTWSKLYKVFARCSALVVTAEENICCEELCAKMTAAIDGDALKVPSTLSAVSSVLQVMVECVDFSPYTPQFQQKLKSPHTPVNWMKKRSKVLGNLTTFQSLLLQCLDEYLQDSEAPSEATGLALVSILSTLFSNLVLANTVTEALTSLTRPLTLLYKQAAGEPPRFSSQLLGKCEKLLSDVLGCLQTHSTLAYDSELLALLSPLLCVLLPHKNKQLRSSVTQFWNGTFANSVSLTYPDEIRPILSQVKQKTPIILPGFEVLRVPDELSEQYSSESSQMETKLSGMPVTSVGKRDSMLGKTPEAKERSSKKTPKPVSTKLDFGSPKPPRREVLEEEASIDFVFIPPETKERVLTEHQKEVKRTKRVDIPAMYNNLDASLDTTVFSQYTQSQEDSLDKLPAEQAVTKEAPVEVPQDEALNEEDPEVLIKDTQDYASPKDPETENQKQEEMIPESTDVSMEDVSKSEDKEEDSEIQTKQGSSPNISGSSDLVSGTPQKPNSRRQSFITLEKYAEGKPASPSSGSKFTGPLAKTSNSQERSDAKKSSSQASTSPDPQESQSTKAGKVSPVKGTPESPVRPKDSGTKCEPVRLTDRLPSDTTEDDDVIPDTQTEAKETTEGTSTLHETESSSQEEDYDSQTLDDSQSSVTETSPGEPRRSGRQRIKPLLPGEEAEERDQKYSKRKRSEGESKGESSSVQSRPNTRSKNAAEEDGGRLRTRAQRDKGESSQTSSQGRAHKKMRLYSNSQDFMDQPEPRRRSMKDRRSSQTDLKSDSQSDSQSQGKAGRRSRSSLETKEEAGTKKKTLPDKGESSQTDSQSDSRSEQASQSRGKTGRWSRSALEKEEEATSANKDLPEKESSQTAAPELGPEEPDQDQLTKDSTISAAPMTSSDSQELDLEEKTEGDQDSEMVTSSPPKHSQDKTRTSSNSLNVSEVKDETRESTKENVEDSQTPSSDSPSLRKSRRSKASSDSGGQSQESEGAETKQKEDSQVEVSSQSKDSQNRTSMLDETHKGTQVHLSQEDSQEVSASSSESQSQRKSRRSKASSDSQTEGQSQESVKKEKRDSLMDSSSRADDSQGETRPDKKLTNEPEVEDKPSQEDSQEVSASSSESQSQHKPRRSKASDPQTEGQSQDSQSVTKTKKEQRDPQMDVSSSQEERSTAEKLTDKPELEDKLSESQSQSEPRGTKTSSDSQTVPEGQSQDLQTIKKTKKEKRDSQVDSSSQEERSTAKKLTNEPEVEDKPSQEDSQVVTPSESQSQRKPRRSKASPDSQTVPESQSQDSQTVRKTKKEKRDSQTDEHKTKEGEDRLSQESSLSESQTLRKSRRSKTSEAPEPEDKTKNKDSSRRQRRSNSQATLDATEQVETKTGGRTRRSMAKEEQSKSSPSLESSQSLDSSESSQGRGRYSRRSSQASVPSVESQGSGPSEAKESPPVPKKRGRKPRASLQSPLTVESKADGVNKDEDPVMEDSQSSQTHESQSAETQTSADVEDPINHSQIAEPDTGPAEERQDEESPMEVEDSVSEKTETEVLKNSETLTESPPTESPPTESPPTESPPTDQPGPKDSETNTENTSSQETGDLKSVEALESVGITAEQSEEKLPADSSVDEVAPPGEAAEHLQVSESPEDGPEESEPGDDVEKDQNENSDSNDEERPDVPVEDSTEGSHDVSLCPTSTDDNPKEEDDIAQAQESDSDAKSQILDCQDVEEAQTPSSENDVDLDTAPTDSGETSEFPETTSNLENFEKLHGSPAKLKDLEAVMGQDVGQSPSGGRTRGSWSPSASPSTSILKKGQKRPLEDETPSPLVKSRRVSFANPIQHQETADDIDRRSPALRTSSPRRSKVSGIPQPKYITTPTKGMLILSPRNLHSPGYKSSKKCLISEMSQEPRPVSRDCIYPALVGCSTPVEAVLPQISSNMWSRGFGQLVRARNIKTVGDLSALTPGEIKTLPIRSPKISNVKKALKIYEQQRKGRGVDELKSFDETEMMTSELEETSAPQNQDEEDKVSGETLAMALLDEPVLPADMKPEVDASRYHTPDTSLGGQSTEGPLQGEGLPSDVDALSCRMTPLELGQCSAQQLVQIHEQLGGMMRSVVMELQTRLCQADGKP